MPLVRNEATTPCAIRAAAKAGQSCDSAVKITPPPVSANRKICPHVWIQAARSDLVKDAMKVEFTSLRRHSTRNGFADVFIITRAYSASGTDHPALRRLSRRHAAFSAKGTAATENTRSPSD